MANNQDTPLDTKADRAEIAPPTEGRTSIILNGAGNGMMVGSIPFGAIALYNELSGKAKLPKQLLVLSGFATVTGCIVGGIFGMREANRLQQYRMALTEQLTEVRAKVDENTARINLWTEKLKVHEKTADAHESKSRG